jgi:hypothetical protein
MGVGLDGANGLLAKYAVNSFAALLDVVEAANRFVLVEVAASVADEVEAMQALTVALARFDFGDDDDRPGWLIPEDAG